MIENISNEIISDTQDNTIKGASWASVNTATMVTIVQTYWIFFGNDAHLTKVDVTRNTNQNIISLFGKTESCGTNESIIINDLHRVTEHEMLHRIGLAHNEHTGEAEQSVVFYEYRCGQSLMQSDEKEITAKILKGDMNEIK